MKQHEWPKHQALLRMAERLLRAWGRPLEWADDILQQVWLSLREVAASPAREAAIKSRAAYAAMVVRSVTIKRIRGETRAECALPEDLAAPPVGDDPGSEVVAVARRELDHLSAAAVTPKQRRRSDMIRAIFELLLQHYETTDEHLSFSEAYRQLCGGQATPSSEKALRYHFDKFKGTVIGAVHDRKEGKK